ncbi:hypothetical protein Tco_0210463 [Tanacetum coccineum]
MNIEDDEEIDQVEHVPVNDDINPEVFLGTSLLMLMVLIAAAAPTHSAFIGAAKLSLSEVYYSDQRICFSSVSQEYSGRVTNIMEWFDSVEDRELDLKWRMAMLSFWIKRFGERQDERWNYNISNLPLMISPAQDHAAGNKTMRLRKIIWDDGWISCDNGGADVLILLLAGEMQCSFLHDHHPLEHYMPTPYKFDIEETLREMGYAVKISRLSWRNKRTQFLLRSKSNGGSLQSHEEFQLPDESQVVLRIPMEHDLYTFHISDLQPEQKVTCLVAKASLDESTRWHGRMAHLFFFCELQNIHNSTQETNVDAGTQDHDSDSEVDEHVIVVPSFPSNSFAGAVQVYGYLFSQATTEIISQLKLRFRNRGVFADWDTAGYWFCGGCFAGLVLLLGSDPCWLVIPALVVLILYALDDYLLLSCTSVYADFIPVLLLSLTSLGPSVNTINPQSQILGDLASPSSGQEAVLTNPSLVKSKHLRILIGLMLLQRRDAKFIQPGISKSGKLFSTDGTPPRGGHFIDLMSAFLYGEIEEEVYGTQLKALEDLNSPHACIQEWLKRCMDSFKHLRALVAKIVCFLFQHNYQRGMPDGNFYSQVKYVKALLTKFDMESINDWLPFVLTASKNWTYVCSSVLVPDILVTLKILPFQLEAYSDACKKLTIVDTFSYKVRSMLLLLVHCAQYCLYREDKHIEITASLYKRCNEKNLIQVDMLFCGILVFCDCRCKDAARFLLVPYYDSAGSYPFLTGRLFLLVVLLVSAVSAGRLVSAGRNMVSAGRLILSAGIVLLVSYGLCLLIPSIHAGGHTSAGGFISADRVFVPAVCMVSAVG